jgi:hypothetical protein
MRVFVCTDHDLHYPVGCASIVVAETEDIAQSLLDDQLKQRGLKPRSQEFYTLQEINIKEEKAIILQDGEY